MKNGITDRVRNNLISSGDFIYITQDERTFIFTICKKLNIKISTKRITKKLIITYKVTRIN